MPDPLSGQYYISGLVAGIFGDKCSSSCITNKLSVEEDELYAPHMICSGATGEWINASSEYPSNLQEVTFDKKDDFKCSYGTIESL